MLSQVSTTSRYFGFIYILNNLKTKFLTPREVGDWFGCKKKQKQKKEGNLFLRFWLILFFFLKKKKDHVF